MATLSKWNLAFSPVKLVLNTLRKMHKSEFWMNFYTDGRNTNFSNLSKWGIKAPMSGTGAINTYWVESGTVYYRAVNGTCVVYFDLWIKAVSIDDAVLATDIPYCWLGVYDYKINASSHAPAVFYIQDNALKCGKSNAGRYFGHLVYPTI